MPQCSNCQFQNMPGVTQCGRCGTSLMLRTAVMDVHPPRATRWAKLWRKTFAARLVRSMRASSKAVERQWGVLPNMELPPLGVLCRLLVPGWAQMFDGRPTLGRGLLLGYGVCLLAAAACFGSTLCSVMLGLAFACHSVSVYDVARRSSPSASDRLFRMMLGCGLLVAGLYLPAYSLATSFVNPIVIQADRLPLRTGDVLLVNVAAYVRSAPDVGDVVQYQMAEASVPGLTIGGVNAVFLFRGPRIDRVLAVPGQVVVWDGERLTIDGQPSSVLPLNPKGARQRLSFTVPTDSYFILPSTEIGNSQFQATEENWKRWSIVGTGRIEGRVFWRSWPWTRIGFVR
ncbi:MAG: S26 family signal peptidase [Planctomycetota bacterium]